MRSHLTRHVFTRLLRDEPWTTHTIWRPARHYVCPNVRRCYAGMQTRSFMGMITKRKRDMNEPWLDPGMEKMLELNKRIHLIARLPPVHELCRALSEFVTAKLQQKQPIQDFHAERLLQTLKEIERHPQEAAQHLKPSTLVTALRLLDLSETDLVDMHAQLGRELFEALKRRDLAKEPDDQVMQKACQSMVRILARAASGTQAKELLIFAVGEGHSMTDRVWSCILARFAQEENEAEVKDTIRMLSEAGEKPGPLTRHAILVFFARRNDVHRTKQWFDPELLETSSRPLAESLMRTLFSFCLRNGEMEWCKAALEASFAGKSEHQAWKAALVAAAAEGKSVDEIDRMVSIFVRRAKESGRPSTPDVDIFNGLISLAISQEDAYMAERYHNLMFKYGVQPDAQTYIQQVEYRLLAADLSGAGVAYEHLRQQPIVQNEDWDIMNRLLRALAAQPNVPKDIVMGLVADISDRKKDFPADTVSALVRYHLERDEYFEVVDLLQTYAYQFSSAQRQEIFHQLLAASLNPEADEGRCWDTYMIWHQVFDIEAKRTPREQIMKRMFELKRADMAVHVFSRMERHMRADTRPNAHTYLVAFEGIAHNQDPEALEVVHNILKLDTETDLDTQLRNALMQAYTSVGVGWRALEFWDEIASSDEGPNYQSLHLVFRACEKTAFGWMNAQKIWNRLLESDIAISPSLLASYVGALSGNHEFDQAVAVLEQAQTITGQEPDTHTLGIFFNASWGVNHQQQTEEWIRDHYPESWRQLVAQGVEEDELGNRTLRAVANNPARETLL